MKATVIIPGGRLTRDVTAVYSKEDGSAKRALFTVAVNSFYKDGDEKKSKADFIPCVAWGNQATLMEKWGLKGRLIAIRGTLETYQKEADENGKYAPVKVYVRVAEIEFLSFEKNVQEKAGTSTTTTTTETPTAATAPATTPNADEVAAAMLKLLNSQKKESPGAALDLSDMV